MTMIPAMISLALVTITSVYFYTIENNTSIIQLSLQLLIFNIRIETLWGKVGETLFSAVVLSHM